ncbi:uncharacterized protein LOC115665328 isoform X1 [Syzygium oleosum]|uniref:uncharacterized protein LOC115665328 isoform X1 n=1 Tax=Syzygium oleosum TaxID=219896 RepID=UPI0024BACF96|nr:uncharacterized protein LOC115665328 isoform X1 [Syzygium oleosum]
MIQDMFGNEFYAGAYKDGSLWRTNRYRDVSQFPMGSSPDMLIWERHLLLYPGSRIESRSMEKVVRKGARAQFCANHKGIFCHKITNGSFKVVGVESPPSLVL